MDVGVMFYYCLGSHRVGRLPLLSIASSGGVGGGPRNMKSMWPPLAAIFFMTYLYRAGGGGMAPSVPPLDPLLLLETPASFKCLKFQSLRRSVSVLNQSETLVSFLMKTTPPVIDST